MTAGLRVCVIPARGGSRRVQKKNIREFYGLPILVYPIIAAQESGLFDQVLVSTDSSEIAAVARQMGAGIIERPKELALDEVGTQEVTRHAISTLDRTVQTVCTLYPCAPMITVDDLAEGLCSIEDDHTAIFSVAVGAQPLRDAGAMYWGFAGSIMERVDLYGPWTRLYVLPEERVCDVNTEEDFTVLEMKYAAWKALGGNGRDLT